MRDLIWNLAARLLLRPAVAAYLVERAWRTPYTDIRSDDGSEIYMRRGWLFNPYGRGADGEQLPARFSWLPSVRIHHICRADQDRDLHDHPWNARTVVLRGWYEEERPWAALTAQQARRVDGLSDGPEGVRGLFHRSAGYSGRLLFGQYHRISTVSAGGVFTLFITWRKRGTWGFLVDGHKVPWRTYLGLQEGNGQ